MQDLTNSIPIQYFKKQAINSKLAIEEKILKLVKDIYKKKNTPDDVSLSAFLLLSGGNVFDLFLV
jgi:hypothetical protein